MRVEPAGADVDVVNIGELHVVPDPGVPRSGAEQGRTGVVRNAAIAIRNGRITQVGSAAEVTTGGAGVTTVDAEGGTVFPGLVESHAHPLFAGNRSHEYAARLSGRPASILSDDEDSGIKYTVRETRRAGSEQLRDHLLEYLTAAGAWGVTTCEVKGGYGLSLDEELRHLRIAADAADAAPVRVKATFGGGHDVPFGTSANSYVDELVEVMLPAVREQAGPVLNDVTCEQGVFSPEQARRVLERARELGMRNKVHADAFADSGGWAVAVECGALSADHLTFTPPERFRRYRGTSTVATVLPWAELVYMTSVRAPARTIIDNDIPLAVATDYCSSIGARSLYRAMTLAAPWFSLSPEEALVGSTLNAAYALGCADEAGSLDVGKWGDLVIVPVPTLYDVFWSEPIPPRVLRAGVTMR